MDHHVARPRRTFVGLAAMAAGAVALVVGAFPGAVGATGGPDGGHGGGGGGHDFCPDGDYWYWHWGPDNQDEVPGEHTEDDENIDPESPNTGDITFTISNVRDEGEGKAFDFTSSVPVTAVSVRGYRDDGHVNEFAQPVTSGTVTGGDDYIKHVKVCPVPETPPTSSSSSSSSSSVPPSSSSSSSSTSSTMAPSTSSSSSTVPTPTTEAPTTSMATTTTVSSGGGLPVTGSNTGLLLGIGGVLLLAGGAFLVAKRQIWNQGA